MAGSVNKVILVGNLGKDPEVRVAQDGNKVVILSVATSEYWRDKTTGETKEKTEWHRVVIFNNHFSDICERLLKKGSKVYVEGQIQSRKWVDPQGQEKQTREILIRYKGEVVALEGRGTQPYHGSDEKRSEGEGNFQKNHFSEEKQESSGEKMVLEDDEIPF